MRVVCGRCGDVLEPVHPNVIVCCECGAYAIDGEDIVKIPPMVALDYKRIIEFMEQRLNNEICSETYIVPKARREEILLEDTDYAASFIINNGKDYDVCQLFKKDMEHNRCVLIDTWVRRDLYMATVKSKDKEIADLKNEIERLKTRINAIYGRLV